MHPGNGTARYTSHQTSAGRLMIQAREAGPNQNTHTPANNRIMRSTSMRVCKGPA